jgi:hypothetical protein
MINPALSLHRVGSPAPTPGRELEDDPPLELLGRRNPRKRWVLP